MAASSSSPLPLAKVARPMDAGDSNDMLVAVAAATAAAADSAADVRSSKQALHECLDEAASAMAAAFSSGMREHLPQVSRERAYGREGIIVIDDDDDDDNKEAASAASSAVVVPSKKANDDVRRKVPVISGTRIITAPCSLDDPISFGISGANQAIYEKSAFVKAAGTRLFRRGAVSMSFGNREMINLTWNDHEFDRMLAGSQVFRHAMVKNEFSNDVPTRDITPEALPLVYVGGSFGGLAVPTFDHCERVRRWREYAHVLCAPVLTHFLEAAGLGRENYKLAQYPDRVLFRRAGVEPTAESWHRDIAPFVSDGDLVFGGWINTSDHPQQFSFIARSHLDNAGKVALGRRGAYSSHTMGFARAGEDDLQEAMRRVKADPNLASRVTIPPGGILLFFENCLHEVLKLKSDRDVRRLFIAFHLTKGHAPLLAGKLTAAQRSELVKTPAFRFLRNHSAVLDSYDCVVDMMRAMAPIPLKSGQCRLMYPHRWWMPNTLRFLLIMSAGVVHDDDVVDALFEWRDTTEKQREHIQKQCTPIGNWVDNQLIKALVVLNDRGDLPGATRSAMLPPRIRVVRQVWPPLSALPERFRSALDGYTPYTDEHLAMYIPSTRWNNLQTPWYGQAYTNVDMSAIRS